MAAAEQKKIFTPQEYLTLERKALDKEMLSLFTADYDSGRKFMLYKSIPSLKEYWTVSLYEHRVQKFFKNDQDNSWILSETLSNSGEVAVSCLDLSVLVPDMYEGVAF